MKKLPNNEFPTLLNLTLLLFFLVLFTVVATIPLAILGLDEFSSFLLFLVGGMAFLELTLQKFLKIKPAFVGLCYLFGALYFSLLTFIFANPWFRWCIYGCARELNLLEKSADLLTLLPPVYVAVRLLVKNLRA